LVNKIKEEEELVLPVALIPAVPVELIARTLIIRKKVGRKGRPALAIEYSTVKRITGIYTQN
jgi:predicted thioredoxin/glutaredoxin